MPDVVQLEVGQPAPDFRLKGPDGVFIALSEYHGDRHVVVVFYPLAFSPVCAHQLPSIQRDLPRIEALRATVMGISVDSHFTNEAFADKLRLSFPLLSDFRREVSAAYGVLLGEAGFSGRAVFVVDRQGRIAYKDVSPDPGDVGQIPSNQKLIEALEALQ